MKKFLLITASVSTVLLVIGIYQLLYLDGVYQDPNKFEKRGLKFTYHEAPSPTLILKAYGHDRKTNTYVDKAFYICVGALYYVGDKFGLNYEEINIVIFCVILPVILIGGILWVWSLYRKIEELKKQLTEVRNVN